MSLRNSTLLFLSVLFVSILPTLAAANEETKTIETPWLVFIYKDTSDQESSTTSDKKSCSGALIDAQVVLTTSTCLDLNLKQSKNLIVEAYNQSRQVSQVNRREFNPRYFLYNNYAVLKLSEPFLLSPHLNTIVLASVDESLDIPKCQQLTYYGKSPDNTTISKVMGKVAFSRYSLCQRDMFQLHISYQESSIIWHPSILCSTHLHILQCIDLKDWSSIVTCPRYHEPEISILVGFQLTFLVFEQEATETNVPVRKDDCIMVYSNMFQASSWIKKQIDNFLKN